MESNIPADVAATPRTDAFTSRCSDKGSKVTDDFTKKELADFARTLERENTVLEAEVERLKGVCDEGFAEFQRVNQRADQKIVECIDLRQQLQAAPTPKDAPTPVPVPERVIGNHLESSMHSPEAG